MRAVVHTDLRAAEGKMRRSGPAAVQPLTANQQQIIKRLLEAHGDDTHVRPRCCNCLLFHGWQSYHPLLIRSPLSQVPCTVRGSQGQSFLQASASLAEVCRTWGPCRVHGGIGMVC